VSERGLAASIEKMRRAGIDDLETGIFRHYYERLDAGEAGVIAEDEIEPVEELPNAEALPDPGAAGREALDRAVVIKLNGGLGTSMGMTGPKSLLEVKDGLTFLDIIAKQVLGLREHHRAQIPLVLMDSFATRELSLGALERHEGLPSDVPADFVQGKVPKVTDDDERLPVEWPLDPDLEWAPPGHGDLYPGLVTSGVLQTLLDGGYRYAFVSNSDNLGAVLDPRILAWFASERLPFALEVADRTEADRKGGHIARRREGGLVLREVAQTRDADLDAFQDITRHRFFNTNNLWLDLEVLARVMDERDGVLGLPMIVNRKTVDPTDKSSSRVIQLETAMGAAIDVFDGAQALRVPRSRFIPVKTTNDLLVLRSDAYELTGDGRVALAAGRDGSAPLVDLDDDFFKLVRDFEERFAGGPPSLVACDRLTVLGDVRFGSDVTCRGEVTVEQRGPEPLEIEHGTVLGG
jgi:UTP--glucose-1-phosphate uridylyltransferase